MNGFYTRAVFFVRDGERALAYYRDQLGFALDWNHQVEGRAFVFQMSLMGCEIILNQTWGDSEGQAGHGRVFIGLEDDQTEALYQHIRDRKIPTKVTHWGEHTLIINDVDGNEIFIWPGKKYKPTLEADFGGPSQVGA